MTSQQAFIGGIIAGMKKAVKRKAYGMDIGYNTIVIIS
jgi:hypothetical protein